MRIIYGFLFGVVVIQLWTSAGIAFGQFFPNEPTAEFGNGSISKIAYSSDGQLLAVCGSGGIFFYDASTLTQVGHLSDDFGGIYTIAFSPDSKLLASGGADSIIRLWDMATRQQITTFTGHNYPVVSVNFSSDGAILASASTDTVRFWDINKKEQVGQIDLKKVVFSDVMQVLFSPDGALVAIAMADGNVLLWDFETKTLVRVLEHKAGFPSITFSADGKMLLSIASTDGRGDLKFWDVETGKQLQVIRNTQNQFLTASPNGDLIASYGWWSPSPVRFWDVAVKKEIAQFPVDGEVSSLTFNPAGDRFACVSNNTTIQIWNVVTRNRLIQKETNTGTAVSLALSPDGHYLALGNSDNTIRLWDIEERVEVARLSGLASPPRILAFSPNGKLLVSDNMLWDVDLRRERFRFAHPGPITDVVFSPSSQLMFSVNDVHTIKIWDIQQEKELTTLQGNDGNARGVATMLAISPDGKLLASGGASTDVYIWDVEKRKLKSVLSGHTHFITSLAFSPDGQILASGDWKGDVILFPLMDKKQVTSYQSLPWQDICVRSLTFSPDGQYIVWVTLNVTKGKIRAFNWRERKDVDSLTFKSSILPSFALSRDGRYLITLGEQILLWDVNFSGLPVELSQKQPTLWAHIKRTALFQNYPNPFNPETWIPYQLAEDSSVTLTIYNAKGQYIRTISLGKKTAGVYKTKEDVIHWDGRNDLREQVSSGIYFYTLQASEYMASGKMLLIK